MDKSSEFQQRVNFENNTLALFLNKASSECPNKTAQDLISWLVGFVALRPKSTAMVISGRSVNLTTLFPGQA